MGTACHVTVSCVFADGGLAPTWPGLGGCDSRRHQVARPPNTGQATFHYVLYLT